MSQKDLENNCFFFYIFPPTVQNFTFTEMFWFVYIFGNNIVLLLCLVLYHYRGTTPNRDRDSLMIPRKQCLRRAKRYPNIAADRCNGETSLNTSSVDRIGSGGGIDDDDDDDDRGGGGGGDGTVANRSKFLPPFNPFYLETLLLDTFIVLPPPPSSSGRLQRKRVAFVLFPTTRF